MPVALVILIALFAIPFALGLRAIVLALADVPVWLQRRRITRIRRAARADLRRALNR
jgi:hypothetical protein